MCKATQSATRLALTLDSFKTPPNLSSSILSGAVVIAVLVAIEQALYQFLTRHADAHDILASQTNRQILARHVGVDAFCCFVLAGLAWQCRDLIQPCWDSCRGKIFLAQGAYETRLWTYHPAAHRIAAFFFVYQVKNMYDTILWNDGPEFIMHHTFSLLTAYGNMTSGCGYMYSIFYFGLSEVSTGVLCLLANFDDEFGVVGLGDAFPILKAILAVAFVVMFILCRCTLWPIASYYFCRDLQLAFKHNDERTQQGSRKPWMRFFYVSLASLSVLQIIWLGQIFILAKEELVKAGVLQ